MIKAKEQGHLLVVDDNEMNRDLLARRLRREGYLVDIAEEGYQALDMIRAGRFDLILLDVMMPGLSGLEMLAMIRKTHSLADLPVIMTTAKDQSNDIVEGLQRGANDYVTKPIDMPVLLARIQTHLKLKTLSQLKDEFLRIASHDLKNPLSTVLMSAHIVRERVPVGAVMQEQFYQMLYFIVKHSEDMQRIIRDFLDFQAMQDGMMVLNLSIMQLNQLAAEVVQSNTDYAHSKSISLMTEFDDHTPTLNADDARIRQVIQNLVGNAIKFCPPASLVIVRTRVADQSIIFEVCDSGPGLTDEDMKSVFSKYSRLSNKPTGGEKTSGLGLAICKQMVALHGGQIGVFDNGLNPGATFWFSLPVESPAIVATRDQSGSAN